MRESILCQRILVSKECEKQKSGLRKRENQERFICLFYFALEKEGDIYVCRPAGG